MQKILQAEISLLRNIKAKCERELATDSAAFRLIEHELQFRERVHVAMFYDSAPDTSDPPDEFGSPSSDTRRNEA
jgi:hypothetical protein